MEDASRNRGSFTATVVKVIGTEGQVGRGWSVGEGWREGGIQPCMDTCNFLELHLLLLHVRVAEVGMESL